MESNPSLLEVSTASRGARDAANKRPSWLAESPSSLRSLFNKSKLWAKISKKDGNNKSLDSASLDSSVTSNSTNSGNDEPT